MDISICLKFIKRVKLVFIYKDRTVNFYSIIRLLKKLLLFKCFNGILRTDHSFNRSSINRMSFSICRSMLSLLEWIVHSERNLWLQQDLYSIVYLSRFQESHQGSPETGQIRYLRIREAVDMLKTLTINDRWLIRLKFESYWKIIE